MTFRILEPHHGYYGAALLAMAGWAALAVHHWPWRLVYGALAVLGAWVLADDIYQHVRQTRQTGYASSIHRWYVRTLYRLAWVRRLNAWLDGGRP
jgi:thiol:disulfide interchange protein